MRVLAPLDGSAATYEALDRGLAILRASGPLELTLFNVRQEGFESANDPEYIAMTVEADEDDEIFPSEASSQRCLERGAEIARKHGVEPRTKIVEGKPRAEILKEAAGHDVLLMHALSRSSIKDALKGSGTEHIARHAPCSVLLVRTG